MNLVKKVNYLTGDHGLRVACPDGQTVLSVPSDGNICDPNSLAGLVATSPVSHSRVAEFCTSG